MCMMKEYVPSHAPITNVYHYPTCFTRGKICACACIFFARVYGVLLQINWHCCFLYGRTDLSVTVAILEQWTTVTTRFVCTCMYVCMHARVCLCVHVCVFIQVFVNTGV